MAVKQLRADASIDASTAMFSMQISGLYADSNMNGGTLAEIAVVGARNVIRPLSAGFFAGIVGTKSSAGHGCTVFGTGTRFSARAEGDLVPGAIYYLGITPDTVDTVATAKDSMGAFLAVTPYDLMVLRVGKLV